MAQTAINAMENSLAAHPLSSFFSMAANAIAMLKDVHRRRPFHGCINSATLDLCNPLYAIADVSEHEQHLAYISPEQTGRMDRGVDHRSDYYSLGVVFYELLSGRRPFESDDAMELIHSHIARQPSPPHHYNPSVPPALGNIVLKLLSKNAEDRYQTLAGLEADLDYCEQALKKGRAHVEFVLGREDIAEGLRIPRKLYGREKEVKKLLSAFAHIAENGEVEIVLVSGYSGVGKTSLVAELHPSIAAHRGIYLSGKFDQFRRDIPYATLAQAFQQFIRQILGGSEVELDRWREAILDAVGGNGQLMIELIPSLEFVIGKQPAVTALAPGEAQTRLLEVFSQFIGAFADAHHPLILFLDDLQWADAGSLKLLEYLLTRHACAHLLLVGAYRDNEVDPTHQLMLALDTIRKAGCAMQDIQLGPLSLPELTGLVVDTLHCEHERAKPLAALIHDRTAGNPFFVRQFLTALYDEQLLTRDPDMPHVWRWEIERIHAKGLSDNVVELMVEKLQRLPQATLDVLKHLACFGPSAPITTLAGMARQSAQGLAIRIDDALRAGFVLRVGERIKFAHDRIAEAAYTLIPQQERSALHLALGRWLLGQGEREDTLFDVVHQMNCGLELASEQERERLCWLNVEAGKKAKASAAFASARNYFAQAVALLPDGARCEQRHEASFALLLDCAECEFLTNRVPESDTMFDLAVSRARTPVERAMANHRRMQTYFVMSRIPQALDLGIETLRPLGVDFPGDEAALAAWAEEARAEVKRRMASRNVADLIDLPVCEDPEVRIVIALLADMVTPAYSSRPALATPILMQALNLCLEHGNIAESCAIYSNYGLLLAGAHGDMRGGYEFSEMALRLNERFGDARLRGRLLFIHGYAFHALRRPLASCVPILQEAYVACREVGNLLFAATSVSSQVWLSWDSGIPLDDVQKMAAPYLDQARQARLGLFEFLFKIIEQAVARLQGAPTDDMDTALVPSMRNYGYAIGHYYIGQQMVHFCFGRHEEALAAAEAGDASLPSSLRALTVMTIHHFYYALTIAALYPKVNEARKRGLLQTLKNQLGKLRRWATVSPENFGSRLMLAEAEVARIEGRIMDAEDYYENAIRSATDRGFIQYAALAHELAGRFFHARGLATGRDAHLQSARQAYLKWGAHPKVAQLDREFPQIVIDRRALGMGGGQFDSMAMLKAYQAISGEIQLAKLLRTLMGIVIETAGAERGSLLLMRDHALRIVAEAKVPSDPASGSAPEITLLSPPAVPDAARVPERIISYVTRTCETVLLADASLASRDTADFIGDAYVRTAAPRSVLVLPILKQGSLRGVLYLENRLAAGAFTPAHVATLEMLSLQAAVSIENALVYDEIEERVAERTSALSAEIAERRRIEGELLEAKEKAEDATQSKSVFLANMSHEIRTPMNAVIGLAHLALRTDLSPRQRDYVGKIHQAATSLLGVINDILDFSKIEAGKLEIEQAEFSLDRVTDTVATVVGHKIEEKGLAFVMRVPADVPRALVGDSLRLGQILTNLVGNAAKFTEIGGVTIVAKRLEEVEGRVRLQFSVEDTGIGMTEEQIGRLFQAFSQADGSITREYGGTGLGLSIAKRLVELMEGGIWVESRPGEGSRFHFTAWFGLGDKEVADAAPARLDSVVQALRLDGARVLLAEDNDINRQVAIELLGNAGVVVDVAENGQIAVDKVLAVPGSYDAVLMDMHMPVMNGLDATRRIRERISAERLPIIAMTASVQPEDVGKCLEVGMNDYIAKPIDPDAMCATLGQWLKPARFEDVVQVPSVEPAMQLRELQPQPAAAPDALLPLARLLGRGAGLLPGARPSAALACSLQLAVALADALGELHARGLAHCQLTPAQILVDRAGGTVSLGDIDCAAPAGCPAPYSPPEALSAASLAYLAPEQTGRMNRSVDARSDLYALGVIFYEMLTGELPFAAADSVAWVHAHMAWKPAPPSARASWVPQTLSDIVMKLLAKMPEDRYQTAGGLAIDLRRCLDEWQGGGRIGAFALGSRDVSPYFAFPEKIYGRAAEVRRLRECFARARGGACEMALVAGYPGAGKSALVNELRQDIIEAGGFYLSGKFDQFKRDIPYAILAQALGGILHQILGGSAEQLDVWREKILAGIGTNGRLLIELIPDLELVIGKRPAVIDLPASEAQARFLAVFGQFVSVLAHAGHPLVLFLDDLQWADAGSLKLLEHLATRADLRHVLLICAYRDNEVDAAHPLAAAVDAVKNAAGKVTAIELAPLTQGDLARLIADTLHCEAQQAQPLAVLVGAKTGGNPFFARQFLATLHEEGLLSFDASAPAWRWDLDRIRAKDFTDNVVELMTAKLQRLPAVTLSVLQFLACSGQRASLSALAGVSGCTVPEIERLLEESLRAGFVLRVGERIKFAHDRIAEAAYTLIPQQERSALHLALGRWLLGQGEREDTLFDVVHQMNCGLELASEQERERLCWLNVEAGKKAKASAAFASARNYFAQAVALLPEGASCGQRHEASFALLLDCAECEFLVGHLEESEALFEQALACAAGPLEHAMVSRLRIRISFVTARLLEGLRIGVETLRLFGIHFPDDDEGLAVAADAACAEFKRRMAGRNVADLIDLPQCADTEVRIVIGVLADMLTPAYSARPALATPILMQALNLSLEHGNIEESCAVYSNYGLLLAGEHGDMQGGYEFSEMALRLNDRFNDVKLRGRLLYIHGYGFHALRRPLAGCVPLLQEAFNNCREIGNVVFIGASGGAMLWLSLDSGAALPEVQKRLTPYLDMARQSGHAFVEFSFKTIEQLTARLQGIRTNGDEFALLPTFQSHGYTVGHYQISQQILHYSFGRFDEALAAAEAADAAMPSSLRALAVMAIHHFYYGLALAALLPESSAEQAASMRNTLAEQLARLARWAECNPANYGSRYALLAAEVARVDGRDQVAMALYEEAVRTAHEHGFVHYEALAHELAARFYRGQSLATASLAHLQRARQCYADWGALGKVAHLDEHQPMAPAAPLAEDRRASDFDTLCVIQAAHALSGEIVLAKLIEALLRIVLQNAGAERGLLLLPQDEQPLQLVAEAYADDNGIRVEQHKAAADAERMPVSLVNYVLRTREKLLLDDAVHAHPHAGDAYLASGKVKALLCLPLIKQTKLVGVLYLENRMLAGVFSPARVALLEHVATQAAISIENAILFEAAEAASRAKSEFLANMSHEIRTPMNAVLGLTQLALKGETAPRQRDYLTKIQSSATSLLGSLNDVLDFAKITAGTLELQRAEFDIKAMLERIQDTCFAQATAKGLVLSCRIDPAVPQCVFGDAQRIAQVLLNLVSNAVKFTERGKVEMRVALDESTQPAEGAAALLMSVRDTGIGMTPEQQGLLFQSFNQLDPSLTRRFGGSGLGLALAKRLVDLMGGGIEVSSTSGIGSVFTVRLVLPVPVMESAPGEALLGEEGTAAAQLRGARVLLVEDNDMNQLVASELLAGAGVEVEIAENGKIAVDRILTDGAQYDAVLMDMQMPVMGGLEATQLIRSKVAQEQLPIIALTAHAMSNERRRCLDAGMNDYLTKPIDIAQLLSTLARWVGAGRSPGAGSGNRHADRPPKPENTPHKRPQQPLVAGAPILPELLPPFDISAALRRVNGNENLLFRLIVNFHKTYGDCAAELRRLLAERRMEDASRMVHTLKGLAGTLEVAAVRKAAERLEVTLREDGETAYLVSELEMALAPAMAAAASLGQAAGTVIRADAGAAPARLERERLQPLIEALAASLADSSIQAEEDARALCELLGAGRAGELGDRLLAQVGVFDFEAAQQTLAGIALEIERT